MQTVFYSATYFHLCNDSNVVLQSLNTCVFLLLPAAQSQSGGHDVRPGVSAQRQRVCRLLQGQKNVSTMQNTNTQTYVRFLKRNVHLLSMLHLFWLQCLQ